MPSQMLVLPDGAFPAAPTLEIGDWRFVFGISKSRSGHEDPPEFSSLGFSAVWFHGRWPVFCNIFIIFFVHRGFLIELVWHPWLSFFSANGFYGIFSTFLDIFLLYNIVCVIELISHPYFVYNQSVPRFWLRFAIWNLFKFSRFVFRRMPLSSYDKHITVLKTYITCTTCVQLEYIKKFRTQLLCSKLNQRLQRILGLLKNTYSFFLAFSCPLVFGFVPVSRCLPSSSQIPATWDADCDGPPPEVCGDLLWDNLSIVSFWQIFRCIKVSESVHSFHKCVLL